MADEDSFAGPFKKRVFGNDPLRVLNDFSVQGGDVFEDSLEVEAASLALLLNGANDIHPPKCAQRFGKASEVLTRSTVRLGAIRTNHFDIAPKTLETDDHVNNYPMTARVCEHTKQTQVIANADAFEECLFDSGEWINTRLAGLRKCLAEKANIICMGEFDYPPSMGDDSLASQFDKAIIDQIEAPEIDFPVLVVAGSRHEVRNEGGKRYCSNRAKLFVNQHMDARREFRQADGDFSLPIDHLKIVSAEKAGERLETPPEPSLQYYDTRLGRIGILICVDAYSPNVILSLINNRKVRSEHKLDYLVVPSYNMSPKFNYACQILSLTCETTVLMVDACKRSARKRTSAGLFVGGRMFSDIVDSTEEDDPTPVGRVIAGPVSGHEEEASYIRVWELNLDYVREQHLGRFHGTPFFNRVEPFLDHLKNKDRQKASRR